MCKDCGFFLNFNFSSENTTHSFSLSPVEPLVPIEGAGMRMQRRVKVSEAAQVHCHHPLGLRLPINALDP